MNQEAIVMERISASVEAETNKLLGLEVIRFIAALSVLVWHYQHFFYIVDKPVDFARDRQPLYSFLRWFYDYGYYGVQVFWCISGFIFFYKYKDKIVKKIVTARKFFIFRFSRLYPLHFFTLLLVASLQAIYFFQKEYYFVYQNNDIYHFILQVFMASNWGFEGGASFNGPIWSVSVEILAYCFFFLAARYVGGSLFLNIAVLVLFLVAKFSNIHAPVFDCLAFFYAGGLSAIVFQHFQSTKYKPVLNALALSIVLVMPVKAYSASIHQHAYFPVLFLLAYIPALLFISAKYIAAPPAIQKTIEGIGNMTYSSYLIHFPIQLSIALYFSTSNQAIPYYSIKFFIGFILITLIASYFIYRFFELPAQNYIRNNWK